MLMKFLLLKFIQRLKSTYLPSLVNNLFASLFPISCLSYRRYSLKSVDSFMPLDAVSKGAKNVVLLGGLGRCPSFLSMRETPRNSRILIQGGELLRDKVKHLLIRIDHKFLCQESSLLFSLYECVPKKVRI